MKKFLVLVITLLITLAVLISGCQVVEGTGTGTGSSSSSGSTSTSTSGSGSGSEDGSGEDQTQTDYYTVTLAFPDGVEELPDLTGIQAKWTNSSGYYTADFDTTGYAYCSGLDGEYTVTITALPEGYTYNPNIYTATGTEEGRNVTIQLYAIRDFDSGTGASAFASDRAAASSTGAYRLTFTSSGEYFYIYFDPNLVSTSYVYSFETLIDVTENEMTASLEFRYWSVPQNTVPVTSSMYDDIVETYCGTYTKNFCYSSEYDSGVKPGYIFAFSIETVDEDYTEPKYLDILISREEYTPSSTKVYKVEVEDYNTNVAAPSGTLTWVSNICNGDLSNCTVELKSDNLWYIYYNDNWYLLYAELNACHYSSADQISYNFTEVSYYVLWDELDENGYPSYADVMSTYTADSTMVSGTYHPVTPQLKTFLYCRATASYYGPLFYDGAGLLEVATTPLTSNDANMWLFACCFYV